MNLKQLTTHIMKLEGKKHQMSVGDCREVIGLLSDLFYSEMLELLPAFCSKKLRLSPPCDTHMGLVFNGEKRALKAKKAKKKVKGKK